MDKGETGTVSFTVQNGGNSALTGITGTVVVDSGHDVTFANEGVVTLGDLAMFGSATSAPIEFTLNDAGTGDELELRFVPDIVGDTVASDYMLSTTTNVDFETRPLVGTSQYEDLNTLSRLNDFTETVMVGGDMAANTWGLDQWSLARTMSVGFDGDYSIEFWHLYNMEGGYDGAVVEVSVNGGDWADVTAMNGRFANEDTMGYQDVGLDYTEASIAGRAMFSGINYGWETINFGEALNGNQVQFRFRIATDSAYVPAPFSGFPAGWYIDDITFSNIQTSIFSDIVAGDTYACDNRIPYITPVSEVEQTVSEGASVSLIVEGTDPNADALTYSWEQTSGTTVTLTGGDTAAMSFSAPALEVGTEELTFLASVFDGTATVTQSFTVNVKADITVRVPKKSSGGSTGLLAFLLLPLTLLRRRRK